MKLIGSLLRFVGMLLLGLAAGFALGGILIRSDYNQDVVEVVQGDAHHQISPAAMRASVEWCITVAISLAIAGTLLAIGGKHLKNAARCKDRVQIAQRNISTSIDYIDRDAQRIKLIRTTSRFVSPPPLK
jgi:hypothetical protein